MSSRKFILFFLGIFILGALPMVIIQPTGAASAGLSSGFALPLEHPIYIGLSVMLGLLAALIGRDGPIFIPVTLVAAMVMGHAVNMDKQVFPAIPIMILVCLLIVIFIAGVLQRKAELLGVLLAASVGFQLGQNTGYMMPDIGMPLYFLIGVVLGVLLITATSISLGLTLFSDEWKFGRSLRDSPRLTGFRSLFR
jgi:hydrogenase/urease accessory protein HupE